MGKLGSKVYLFPVCTTLKMTQNNLKETPLKKEKGFIKFKMGKEKNTKEHRCKFCVFIVGAGNTVRVILTEGGRIIFTDQVVP